MKRFGIYNFDINQKLIVYSKYRFTLADDNELVDKMNGTSLKSKFYNLFRRVNNGNATDEDEKELVVAFGILGGVTMKTLVGRFGAEKVAYTIGKPLSPVKVEWNRRLPKALSDEYARYEKELDDYYHGSHKADIQKLQRLSQELLLGKNFGNKEMRREFKELEDYLNKTRLAIYEKHQKNNKELERINY